MKPFIRSRKEKGQSLVELASVFLLLMLLLVGIVDLGSMFYTYTALRDTSQEGAIYGATHPTDTAGITKRIQHSTAFPIEASKISSIDITCDGFQCETTNIHSCQGKKISVVITYNYQVIMPLIHNIIGRDTVTLTATVSEPILQSSETIDTLSKLPTPIPCP